MKLLNIPRFRNIGSILKYALQMASITLIIGIIMYYAVSRILIHSVEESLVRFAELGAETIDTYLDGRISELNSIAANSTVSNSKLPVKDRLGELKTLLDLDSYKRLSIADVNGNSETTDGIKLKVDDREYFKKALKGIPNISDPIISRADNTLVIVFAVPIFENGNVTGVLYATYDADILSRMTDKIKLNSKGSSFIIDGKGNTIAHTNRTLVYIKDNDSENVKTNHELKRLVELEKQMVSGRSGSGDYVYNGIEKYMGYYPIGDTGWSLAVTSPKSEVFGPLNGVFIILIIAVIAVTIILAWLFSNSIILKNNLSRQQVNSTRIADVTNLIVFTIDRDGLILSKNKHAEKFFRNFEQNDNKIQNIFELLAPDEEEKLKDVIITSLLQNSNASFELAIRRDGCAPLYLFCNMTGDNEFGGTMEIMGLDITDRVESQKRLQDSFDELSAVYDELAEKEEGLRNNYNELKRVQDRLELSENRYQLVIEGSNDAIWDWDAENDTFFYSDKFYEMTGYDPSGMGLRRKDLMALIHPDDVKIMKKAAREYFSGKQPTLKCEIRLKLANGDYKWFMLKGKAVFNDANGFVRAAGSLTDINERKTYEQMIRKLAYTDSLTGLPNRAAFYDEIGNVISKYGETNMCALIYMDLDNFKYVNDSFSHYIGDLLLVEVGKRLNGLMTGNDFIARLEGDEFVVFVRHFETYDGLSEKIRAVISAFHEPFVISGNTFHITVSCGISIYPEHAVSIDDLLKNSDMAMYQAKKDGKNKHVIFEKSMNDDFVQRINKENGLRKAIKDKEFILHYQPQYDLVNGRITGFEALIRWMSPQHGMIPPLKFIGIAEETGLIVSIGRWVLQTACGFIKRLNDTVRGNLSVAVNVSVTQLLQADFVQMVRDVLIETELEPKFLELELTESRLMEAVELNLQKLSELRSLGVKISIDDFGKGFSSLSYLKQLPINSLKIDKSFVDDIQTDGNCMIESIIHIGHQRGLVVIAEGVEKKEQMEYLLQCNCDKVQGYYYSRPVPEYDIIRLLQ